MHGEAQALMRMSAQVGFNVELGGYFSIKRNAVAISGDTFLKLDQVTDYCRAALEVFRCVALNSPVQSCSWQTARLHGTRRGVDFISV